MTVSAERSDWRIVHFAEMSSHVHWLGIAGHCPLEEVFKGLNSGMALWLNERQGRTGPVFAGRPRAIICTNRTAAVITAYVSNNPPRAGVVELASESDWTAHRFYLDPGIAPRWLHIELGLELAGFGSREAERRRFDDFVNERRKLPRNDALNGRDLPKIRRDARKKSGLPTEIATPVVDIDEHGVSTVTPLVSRADESVMLVHDVSVQAVLEATRSVLGITRTQLGSPSPSPQRSAARRLALMVWTRALGQHASEMAALLGISRPAASALLRRNPTACASIECLVPAVIRVLDER